MNINAIHPTHGEVTIVKLLPMQLPVVLKEEPSEPSLYWPLEDPRTDELYYHRALVIDGSGKEVVVPLRELELDGKPLIQHVLEHEFISKVDKPPEGEPHLHSHYGIVEVLEKYDDESWLCRIQSGDIAPDIKYQVDFDRFSRRKLPTHSLKELICHPSELLPLKNIKDFKPKDNHLYVAYSDTAAVAESLPTYRVRRKTAPTSRPSANTTRPSATSRAKSDFTVKGIEEFLIVLADLPRTYRTIRIPGTQRFISYKETPRVIARGETTGRIYNTPAWWLWRVNGEQGPHGKVAERYRWTDPHTKTSPPPPPWFSYDPESEDTYHVELPTPTPQAWYWKLPATTARELGISALSIKWSNAPKKKGVPIAIISLTYKGKGYQVPVYTSPSGLYVKVKTREIAAFLCRYTIVKATCGPR